MLSHLLSIVVKVLFTGVLLLVITLCGLEIWRLWFDRTLVLVPFGYIRNGEPATEAGQNFTQLVSQDLNHLRDIYTGRLSNGDVLIPSTDQLGRGEDIPLPELRESVLSSIEIEAYGIHLSTIFRSLFRQIEQPNVIVGSISESSRGIDVYAELRNVAPDVGAKMGQGRWYFSEMKDVNDASFALACRIFRILLARESPVYANVSDAEFCVFTRSLQSYQRYRSRLATMASEEEIKESLTAADHLISELSNRNSRFPFVYKLEAYIFREQGNLEEAEKALTRYLELLDNYDETDKDGEEFLSALRGEKPPAEVKVSQTAQDLKLRDRKRPIQPGTSVSSIETTAGTICCIVRDKEGVLYVLSADHVLLGDIGTPVVQPGLFDGGQASDQIAEIAHRIAPQPDKKNQVAGAIARLRQGVEANPEIPGIRRTNGIATSVQPGEVVRIVGRTSGVAEGQVERVNVTAQISSPEPMTFTGLIQTSPMSAAGDSGAPVLTEDGRLVGFIYAGSSVASLVMPIQPVLQALKVELVQ